MVIFMALPAIVQKVSKQFSKGFTAKGSQRWSRKLLSHFLLLPFFLTRNKGLTLANFLGKGLCLLVFGRDVL